MLTFSFDSLLRHRASFHTGDEALIMAQLQALPSLGGNYPSPIKAPPTPRRSLSFSARNDAISAAHFICIWKKQV